MSDEQITPKKLSLEQAHQYIIQAWGLVEKHKAAKYRFGQALYNLVPAEITEAIWFTENDFFHKTDSEEVLRIFFEHCVEE